MIEIITGAAHPLLGKTTPYDMPESSGHEWRQHQFLNQMPLLTSQWSDAHGAQMGGMQDVDLRMFQHESSHYNDSYASNSGHLLTTNATYQADGHWQSDVDMGTPSTSGFGAEATEGYHQAQPNSSSHLRLPQNNTALASTHSPQSSHGGNSPHFPQVGYKTDAAMHGDDRPSLSRSVTAPEPRQRRTTASSNDPAAAKRGVSEDGDEEYVPVEDTKNRGRKRQRIPHTAVERRYRENLNAHLDKLRQTVPALAARRPSGSKANDMAHEGVKPSKCEILNGAIEHITALDKENQTLKDEVKLLRARLQEIEKRYRNPRGGAFGA